MEFSTRVRPKNLIIGPGAMAFYLFLGKLTQVDTSDVQAISGCSSGAILALLWVVFKGDIPEMLDLSLTVPIKTIMKPNIKNLLINFGLVPFERVQKNLQTIFFKSFGKEDMTFGELYKVRPIDLYVSTFCVDRCETVYFSWKSHPNQSVVDVISASIAVPLIFSAVLIGPWRYVDGGVQEEAPFMPFVDRPAWESLALLTTQAPPRPTKNISSFIMNLFNSALRMRHKSQVQSYKLDTSNIDLFDFSADRLRLFCDGQKSCPLINAAHNSIRPCAEERLEAHLRQGEQGAKGVLIYPEGEQDACQGGSCI